ncbi:hypothetical protein KUTeg_020273 [Tegillarca granosa]|uniref:acylglycerol lipase n=1 Tax=Tegillarca granosa TaxID=220873 RepID=A0ABQ9EBT4_TEGGR|nr:hypothetical protein KUTeg_020273 [Tegillarca granosa]
MSMYAVLYSTELIPPLKSYEVMWYGCKPCYYKRNTIVLPLTPTRYFRRKMKIKHHLKANGSYSSVTPVNDGAGSAGRNGEPPRPTEENCDDLSNYKDGKTGKVHGKPLEPNTIIIISSVNNLNYSDIHHIDTIINNNAFGISIYTKFDITKGSYFYVLLFAELIPCTLAMVLPVEVMYPVAVVATTFTTATVLLFFTRPHILLKTYMRLAVLLSGMKIKYVTIDGLRICYGERGRKKNGTSSMLLLHGFSADKFMWVPLVKNLPSDIHVIVLDLPGHGDSDVPDEDDDLSFMSQVKGLHQIIQTVGLDTEPFHIIGLSMGGTLAGLYAAEYPNLIDRVTLMCPAMKTPIATQVAMKIREIAESGDDEMLLKDCPLIPKTLEEIQYLFEFAQFHKPTYLPKQVAMKIREIAESGDDEMLLKDCPLIPKTLEEIQYLFEFAQFHKPTYYQKVFKSLASLEDAHILEKNAHRIKVPSQLVWGEEDQVIHVSGAEVLRQKLPNCQSVHIIPRCGHAINLDRPGSKTKALLDFRGELSMSKKRR